MALHPLAHVFQVQLPFSLLPSPVAQPLAACLVLDWLAGRARYLALLHTALAPRTANGCNACLTLPTISKKLTAAGCNSLSTVAIVHEVFWVVACRR